MVFSPLLSSLMSSSSSIWNRFHFHHHRQQQQQQNSDTTTTTTVILFIGGIFVAITITTTSITYLNKILRREHDTKNSKKNKNKNKKLLQDGIEEEEEEEEESMDIIYPMDFHINNIPSSLVMPYNNNNNKQTTSSTPTKTTTKTTTTTMTTTMPSSSSSSSSYNDENIMKKGEEEKEMTRKKKKKKNDYYLHVNLLSMEKMFAGSTLPESSYTNRVYQLITTTTTTTITTEEEKEKEIEEETRRTKLIQEQMIHNLKLSLSRILGCYPHLSGRYRNSNNNSNDASFIKLPLSCLVSNPGEKPTSNNNNDNNNNNNSEDNDDNNPSLYGVPFRVVRHSRGMEEEKERRRKKRKSMMKKKKKSMKEHDGEEDVEEEEEEGEEEEDVMTIKPLGPIDVGKYGIVYDPRTVVSGEAPIMSVIVHLFPYSSSCKWSSSSSSLSLSSSPVSRTRTLAIIGIGVSHGVMDGYSISKFIQLWGDECCKLKKIQIPTTTTATTTTRTTTPLTTQQTPQLPSPPPPPPPPPPLANFKRMDATATKSELEGKPYTDMEEFKQSQIEILGHGKILDYGLSKPKLTTRLKYYLIQLFLYYNRIYKNIQTNLDYINLKHVVLHRSCIVLTNDMLIALKERAKPIPKTPITPPKEQEEEEEGKGKEGLKKIKDWIATQDAILAALILSIVKTKIIKEVQDKEKKEEEKHHDNNTAKTSKKFQEEDGQGKGRIIRARIVLFLQSRPYYDYIPNDLCYGIGILPWPISIQITIPSSSFLSCVENANEYFNINHETLLKQVSLDIRKEILKLTPSKAQTFHKLLITLKQRKYHYIEFFQSFFMDKNAYVNLAFNNLSKFDLPDFFAGNSDNDNGDDDGVDNGGDNNGAFSDTTAIATNITTFSVTTQAGPTVLLPLQQKQGKKGVGKGGGGTTGCQLFLQSDLSNIITPQILAETFATI